MTDISILVNNYKKYRSNYTNASYNETQLRNDFIDPCLKCLGWDVDNLKGQTQFLRDVIQEEYIEVEDSTSKKNPDYTLRVNGTRKLFVEAKKPSVDILKSAKSAFQTRRYGWNANLGISILTNFENIVIYDCRFKPNSSDAEHVARIKKFHYTDYEKAFEEIRDIISYESAVSGRIDDLYSVYERAGDTFDSHFLVQIEKWRTNLAESAVRLNNEIDNESVNFLVQRLLNKIIFLRICEDRSIERFETLKNIKDYDSLKEIFTQSDKKYNSGLFDFIEDGLSLKIKIDSDVLIEVFSELYYPLSPYDFSVVDTSILSQIYEKFLGSKIVLDEKRKLSILEEPEVSASNGVVPTPKIIVEKIVQETLKPILHEKKSQEILELKVADICCGSGTFLISSYDFLLRTVLERLIEEGSSNPELVHKNSDGSFSLTLNSKRKILENIIHGVDINPYAVEVTKFSLLLKLLEDENAVTVEDFINQFSGKVLPNLKENIKCGNSLVDSKFYDFMDSSLEDDSLLLRTKPFDWGKEFSFLKSKKGFDAIVGNPPYVRIQNLVKYTPEEIKYYQSKESGFSVAVKESIDKYYVFIQRAIFLLNDNGFLGYIVPHKFFINKGGKSLRKYITENSQLSKLIHFGVTQVFPERSTYTAIIIIQKESTDSFQFKKIDKITPELLSDNSWENYRSEKYKSDPWVFLPPEVDNVFEDIRSQNVKKLKEVAEIAVGLQTSNDSIYIFTPEDETAENFIFTTKSGVQYEIEKDICRPCIYDLSFDLFDSIKGNAQMIFPYEITDRAEVFPEKFFQEEYPLCWEYLNKHKSILEKRSLNGRDPKWYQFGRSQSLTRFHNAPKLIWSVLSTKPAYIFDDNDLQFTGGGNGPYYSLLQNSDYSIFYLLGILSHPVFESMVKAGASEFRGEYYSHGKQFIENLPIRVIDCENAEERSDYKEIIKLVKELIKTKDQLNTSFDSKKSVFERKLDVLNEKLIKKINKLYQISDEDYQLVTNDALFFPELTDNA